MHILKYKKLKNGEYELILDEGSIYLHEDLILKYNLLLTKEIDEDLLLQLEVENQKYMAYNQALKLLERRLRSRKELTSSLIKKGYEDTMVEEALQLLEKQGYVNDQIFAQSFVHDRILLSMDGPYKIANELTKRGVDESIKQEVLTVYTEDLQREKLNKLIAKEVKNNHTKSKNLLLKSMINHFITMGYDRSMITTILDHYPIEEDESIRKKEYDKLYKKLSPKYSGAELELRIKQKMFQKGFSIHE